MKITIEQKEAGNILKGIESTKCVYPKEKNILKWDVKELRAYILKETSGMNATKKIKFAQDLNKRIKLEKEKQNDKH